MSTQEKGWSRRDFLKTTGAAAAGSVLAPIHAFAETKDEQKTSEPMTVPTRPFGKTGVNVSILSLGGMFDIPSNLLLLKKALEWGVTYWDTAEVYEGGKSESGIGKYFEKYPEDRKKVFLVTKSKDRDPEGLTKMLNQSLERLKTSTIDLYFVHGIASISELNDETKKWAEKAKADKKIRFFGFSTHKNMEQCMMEAAKLGWIDGIMMTYNFRNMHTDEMKAAVDVCVKAGIGLTAMKTQGRGPGSSNTETELKLVERFLQSGFTDKQANLKAVWENPNIACICSQMPNMTILMSNVAAALNKTKISSTDMELLRRYARETCSDYCTGCSERCESLFSHQIPISNVMRYLMYARFYGDRDRAKTLFNKISPTVRSQIASLDFSQAELICPQKMAIGKLMRQAAEELA